jgi:uncharacterized protein YqgC (DUF456 family)
MNDLLLNLVVAAAVAASAVGIVLPVLPGTALALGAFLVWAVATGGATAWGAFAAVAAVLIAGHGVKYLLPQRSLAAAQVPGRSIAVGGAAGLLGFFTIPVMGLGLGFVSGIYAAEQVRLGDWRRAKESTWIAMRAVGFSVLIELGALALATAVWAGVVLMLAQQ